MPKHQKNIALLVSGFGNKIVSKYPEYMSATFLRQNQTPSERIKQQKREWYYRNKKSVLKQQKKSEERKESKKE